MRDIDKSGETREEKRETLREMVMEGDLGEGGTGGVVGEIKRFSPAERAAQGGSGGAGRPGGRRGGDQTFFTRLVCRLGLQHAC